VEDPRHQGETCRGIVAHRGDLRCGGGERAGVIAHPRD
jgi:hypothetical protein